MRVGFVVAMEDEYAPFLSSLGAWSRDEKICGIVFSFFAVSDASEVVLARSGIGVVAASAATSLLIGRFSCDYIVNFGLVGSLKGLPLGTLVAVNDVVHYDSDLTAFDSPLGAPADFSSPFFLSDRVELARLMDAGLPALRLASGDKFIADEARKNSLISDFSADVCDMEGAGVAITCARACVPFTMLKLVSDGAGEGAADTFAQSKGRSFDYAVSVVRCVIEGV